MIFWLSAEASPLSSALCTYHLSCYGVHADLRRRAAYRYICSRVYLSNPPGDDNALALHPDLPEAVKEAEEELKHDDPEMNPIMCVVLLAVTVALTAATAEWVSTPPLAT